METWRLLPVSREPMSMHLAGGAALLAGLEATGQPALRWYRASSHALVLGIGQKRAEMIDHDACRAAGIEVLRRASGGTAVLVDPGMLMLDAALPRAHRLFSADVTCSYRWFGEAWCAALQQCGVPARVLPTEEARAAALPAAASAVRQVCFGTCSPYEVLVERRKLVGFAQVRRRAGALLHAGVAWHWEPQALANLLALDVRERAEVVWQLQAGVAGLDSWLGSSLVLDAALPRLMEAFAVALREQQGVVLEAAEWREEELAARRQAVEHDRSAVQ